MAEENIYTHRNHQGQEIRYVSAEKLAAHPTGVDLFEGRFWQLTTDDHIYHYSGGVIRQLANATDLNRFGGLIGGHDASGGLVPTTGSGLNDVGSPDLSIQAGDSWRVTVAGTIVGLAGEDALSVGDVLIALIDGAAVAADFMSVQGNFDDGIADEVITYASLAVFPGTGSVGIVYVALDTDIAYVWDGAAYVPLSLPNIQHEATLGAFPVTGDADLFYVADDTQFVYFWDGAAYIPVSSAAFNLYNVDGTLTGNRTVSGGSNNLTFTGLLAYTLSSATYSKVTTGNSTETVGGNKIETTTGSSSETSAGKRITSTGAGNNVTVATDVDGAFIVPSSANPDANVTAPLSGMVKYDSTDREFRFYQNGTWVTYIVKPTGLFLWPAKMTAAAASLLVPVDGDTVYVTTTDGTFTTVGFWGYENGAWGRFIDFVAPATYDLGAANDFVVLAGDDLVDTAPQFFTTGDVGYVTTETGTQTFGTGSLKTGGALGTSVADVAALKVTLLALAGTAITTPGALETSEQGYGPGVFVPGVYTTAAAIVTGAAGTITLSGDGDFVIKSTVLSLTFGAGTIINLINGAKASRVFWVMETDLGTTGANSTVKGNFIVRDATIASTNNVEGRILASRDVTIDGTATSIYLPLS